MYMYVDNFIKQKRPEKINDKVYDQQKFGTIQTQIVR